MSSRLGSSGVRSDQTAGVVETLRSAHAPHCSRASGGCFPCAAAPTRPAGRRRCALLSRISCAGSRSARSSRPDRSEASTREARSPGPAAPCSLATAGPPSDGGSGAPPQSPWRNALRARTRRYKEMLRVRLLGDARAPMRARNRAGGADRAASVRSCARKQEIWRVRPRGGANWPSEASGKALNVARCVGGGEPPPGSGPLKGP
jgi:hypothetical protein